MRTTKPHVLNKYGIRAFMLFCLLCFLLIGKSSSAQLVVTANSVVTDTVNLCITQSGSTVAYSATGFTASDTVDWVFTGGTSTSNTGGGPHIVTYSGNGIDTVLVSVTNVSGTIIDTDTIYVFTSTLPNANINSPASTFCKNDPLFTVNVSPNGGIFSGPPGISNGKFNPNSAGVGTHTIYYTVTNGICSSSDSVVFTVIPAPTAVLTSTTTPFPDTTSSNTSIFYLYLNWTADVSVHYHKLIY